MHILVRRRRVARGAPPSPPPAMPPTPPPGQGHTLPPTPAPITRRSTIITSAPPCRPLPRPSSCDAKVVMMMRGRPPWRPFTERELVAAACLRPAADMPSRPACVPCRSTSDNVHCVHQHSPEQPQTTRRRPSFVCFSCLSRAVNAGALPPAAPSLPAHPPRRRAHGACRRRHQP